MKNVALQRNVAKDIAERAKALQPLAVVLKTMLSRMTFGGQLDQLRI